MAITADYSGETFVAFTDLSGFQAMMTKETRLMRAMDALYSAGYGVLRRQTTSPRVEGFFVSDCGILFSRREGEPILHALHTLLQVVSVIHRRVFESAFSLTTSIAFGSFTHRGKIEFEGLGKAAIHGNAYVAAFRDNESKKPRLYANECRILKKGLPPEVNADSLETVAIARGRMREEDLHWYFDWMRESENS